MKALVLVAPHRLLYRDEPDPVPGPGEALIKVEAVGMCGSDMHAIAGHDPRRPVPIILGYKVAGRVLQGALAGRRVAVNPLIVPPDCPSAQEGRPHLSPRRQILSLPPRPGGFAEYVVVPEENLFPVPETLQPNRPPLRNRSPSPSMPSLMACGC